MAPLTKKTRKKLAFALASFFIALLGTIVVYETIEHILYYRWKSKFDNYGWFGKVTIPSPNKILMWEYKPNGVFKEIKTNRYGFRESDEISLPKPVGVYRIAFVGDSVTLGIGVENDYTFVRQFETAANSVRPGRKIQALNFSVDGYHTIQIAELLRSKVLQFEPDKVVYVLCLNDFDFSESRVPIDAFLLTTDSADDADRLAL